MPMDRSKTVSKYEIRREISQGISYRGSDVGRSVRRVRFVVYRDGHAFSQFTTRFEAEQCVRECLR